MNKHFRSCGQGSLKGDSQGKRLDTVARLAWSAAFFGLSALIQGLGGRWTGSIGLVSDALENLNDVLVNLLGVASLTVANRRQPCERFTYGWHRLEVFNTLAGAAFLLLLASGVSFEAIQRFRHPVVIRTGWVLLFSFAGLVINVGATLMLRPRDVDESHRDSSLKAAYLHAFSDALTSIALVLSMIVIRYTGWRWVDPLMALLIVLVILRGALVLVRDAVGILMHRAAFDHAQAKARLMEIQGVTGIADLRSWKVCSHLVVATAHVQVSVERLDETSPILAEIQRLMAEAYQVRHITVHFETAEMAQGHSHRFNHQHEVDVTEDERHGHQHHGHQHHGHGYL